MTAQIGLAGYFDVHFLDRKGAKVRTWNCVKVSHFTESGVVFWQDGHKRPTLLCGALLVEPVVRRPVLGDGTESTPEDVTL